MDFKLSEPGPPENDHFTPKKGMGSFGISNASFDKFDEAPAAEEPSLSSGAPRSRGRRPPGRGKQLCIVFLFPVWKECKDPNGWIM